MAQPPAALALEGGDPRLGAMPGGPTAKKSHDPKYNHPLATIDYIH